MYVLIRQCNIWVVFTSDKNHLFNVVQQVDFNWLKQMESGTGAVGAATIEWRVLQVV